MDTKGETVTAPRIPLVSLIKIRCPLCGQKIAVEREHCGLMAACPNVDCGSEFRVPEIPPDSLTQTPSPTAANTTTADELLGLENQYREHEVKYSRLVVGAAVIAWLTIIPFLVDLAPNTPSTPWRIFAIIGVSAALGVGFMGVLHNMRRLGQPAYFAPIYMLIVFLTAGLGSMVLDSFLDKNRRRRNEMKEEHEAGSANQVSEAEHSKGALETERNYDRPKAA